MVRARQRHADARRRLRPRRPPSALVEKWFGTFPATRKPARGAGAHARRPGAAAPHRRRQPRASCAACTTPGTRRALFAPGDAELDLLASALAQPGTGRLYKILVLEKRWARSVAAYQESRELSSIFHVFADLQDDAPLAEVEKVIDDELDAGDARAGQRGRAAPRRRRLRVRLRLGPRVAAGARRERCRATTTSPATPTASPATSTATARRRSPACRRPRRKYLPKRDARRGAHHAGGGAAADRRARSRGRAGSGRRAGSTAPARPRRARARSPARRSGGARGAGERRPATRPPRPSSRTRPSAPQQPPAARRQAARAARHRALPARRRHRRLPRRAAPAADHRASTSPSPAAPSTIPPARPASPGCA